MSYPKLTPIIAKGATEPRYLEDRFADIVNVKDFGAKGDGETDDTAAFVAARAVAGTDSVFVPAGTYVVSSHVGGDFVASGNVVISGVKTVYVKKDGLARNKYRKDIIVSSTASSTTKGYVTEYWGEGAWLSPQGLFIDENYNFYVIYAPGNTSLHTTDISFVVEKLNASGEYVGFGVFPSDLFVEQIVIEDGKMLFYGSSTELYSYDISDFSWNGLFTGEAEKTTVPVITNNDFQIFKINEDFCNSTRSYSTGGVDSSVSRELVFRFDSSLSALKGYTCFDYADCGWAGVGTQNNGTDSRLAYPKRQSICADDAGLVACMGGSWLSSSLTDDPEDGWFQQGLILFTLKGERKDSILCRPDKMVAKLNSLGVASDRIEAEGVVFKDGQYFTIYAVNNQSRYVILRELSESASSIDFFDCRSAISGVNEKNVFFNLPAINKKFYNPDTGEQFTDILSMLLWMRETKRQLLRFHMWSDYNIGLNDLPIPKQTATITIENRNAAFYLYCNQPWHKGNYTLFVSLNNDEIDAKNTNGITAGCINVEGTPASGYGSKIYCTTEDSSFAVLQFEHASDSYDQISYGGGSGLLNAVAAHKFYAANNYGDKSGNCIVRINKEGLWPDTTDSKNCGLSNKRWNNVYAATASIQTSDERSKDNIASVDERLMRAWSNVRFNVFQFKDAIDKKGAEHARLHVGVIAQQIQSAFASEGIDPNRYALFCYDEWDDQYEDIEVADGFDNVTDENGSVVEVPKFKLEKRLVTKAGSAFGIRYEEALALECAYQRWRLEQLEERINQLTNNNNNN